MGTDRTVGTGSDTIRSSFPYSVLRSRWLLVVAVTALVAFGGQRVPSLTQLALVGAMILSNLVLGFLRGRGIELTQALEVITVADVLIVTVVVGWVDPTPQTYLAVFAALILAMALGRVSVIMGLMLLLCGVYGGYLYTEVGPSFSRQVALVLRIPFFFAVGLHFASIASYLREEKAQRGDLLAKAKQQAERADQMAKQQDRLRALSQIGRLALTSAEAHPLKVLMEMTHRAQKALGAQRCSLLLFARNAREATWNGKTKDRNTEVRTLDVEPQALQRILRDGKLTELFPGEDKDLMERVKVFFPDSNPFGSILVAPVGDNDGVFGALFLIDANHKRSFSEGERDFFWTVSLMTGAFIDAREKLENELQLRALITNAPVIMFALSKEGVVTLFEGRGCAVLGTAGTGNVGKPLAQIVDNPKETQAAFAQALSGRMAAGTMSIGRTLFETQYSPLHGVDGEISGVIGVTTAILDSVGQPAASSTLQPAPLPTSDDEAPLPLLVTEPPARTPDGAAAGSPSAVAAPSTPDAMPRPAAPVPAAPVDPEHAPLPLLDPDDRPQPPPPPPRPALRSDEAALPLISPVAPPPPTNTSPPPPQLTARELAASQQDDASGVPQRTPMPSARPDIKPMIPLADEDDD